MDSVKREPRPRKHSRYSLAKHQELDRTQGLVVSHNRITEYLHGDMNPRKPKWDWKSDGEFVAQLTQDLRKLAALRLRSSRPDISVSSLIQESLVKLLNAGYLRRPEDRAYIYTLAHKIMRCIIVDHIRSMNTQKRKANRTDLCLDFVAEALQEQMDVLVVHEAIEELAKVHQRQASVVDLRFFGSYTMPEISEKLGIGLSTAETDWAEARLWLHKFLSR